MWPVRPSILVLLDTLPGQFGSNYGKISKMYVKSKFYQMLILPFYTCHFDNVICSKNIRTMFSFAEINGFIFLNKISNSKAFDKNKTLLMLKLIFFSGCWCILPVRMAWQHQTGNVVTRASVQTCPLRVHWNRENTPRTYTTVSHVPVSFRSAASTKQTTEAILLPSLHRTI